MRRSIFGCALAAACTTAAPAFSQAFGGDLAELLSHVRQFSPDLKAMVLEADAAAARASAADSLDDPVFRVSFEDLDRRDGIAPRRVGAIFYTIEQEFPLWGKRELRKRIAVAEARGARAREQALALELEARVKAAYARHYQAHEAIEITRDVVALLGTVARISEVRLAQGLGAQAETLRVLVEKTHAGVRLHELRRELETAQAELNALLDRPAGAPLAAPDDLPPIPSSGSLSLGALVEMARNSQPALAADRAAIEAAEGQRSLADKAWYPDVTLGFSVVDRERRLDSYEAMVAFRIPIRGDLKDAARREAIAKLGASSARLQAAEARLRGEIETALRAIEAAQRVELHVREELLPQTEGAVRASLAAFEQGKGTLTEALDADRRRRDAKLDLLRAETEQRVMLALIERLAGGDL